jgi:hypothetical protein
MTRTTIAVAAALGLAVMLPALPAQAQAARTFVSAAGSDSNNCINAASPCRHFATAFAATAAGGEIYVLDPANYGSLTITHAVSIQGHGWGSVSPASAGGAAITINAQSNDVVSLHGLTLSGTGSGGDGILFNSGGALEVIDSTISNFIYNGIYVGALAGMSLVVQNTIILNISQGGNASGIYLVNSTSSKSIVANLDHVTLSNNDNGITMFATGGSIYTGVSNTQIANTLDYGIHAQGTGGVNFNQAYATLKNVTFNSPASTSSVSIYLSGNSTAYLSQVTQIPLNAGVVLSDTVDNVAFSDGTNHVPHAGAFGTWTLD